MDCATVERFEAIAERAIAQAQRLGRTLEEFAEGLRDIETAIRERAEQAEDES